MSCYSIDRLLFKFPESHYTVQKQTAKMLYRAKNLYNLLDVCKTAEVKHQKG